MQTMDQQLTCLIKKQSNFGVQLCWIIPRHIFANVFVIFEMFALWWKVPCHWSPAVSLKFYVICTVFNDFKLSVYFIHVFFFLLGFVLCCTLRSWLLFVKEVLHESLLYPSQHLVDDHLPQKHCGGRAFTVYYPSVLSARFIVCVYLYDRVKDFILYSNAFAVFLVWLPFKNMPLSSGGKCTALHILLYNRKSKYKSSMCGHSRWILLISEWKSDFLRLNASKRSLSVALTRVHRACGRPSVKLCITATCQHLKKQVLWLSLEGILQTHIVYFDKWVM